MSPSEATDVDKPTEITLEARPTIYLIDGTAIIYRAFHAIRHLTNSKGLPTNAIFGFTRILIKWLEDATPEYAIMFFDSKGPTFRHEMYPKYKANRPPMSDDLAVQLPYIRKVTTGFNLPIMEKKGYEADDLIGTISRIAQDDGFDVVMMTGDKDFMQLVTPHAVLWDPMKEKEINMNTIRDDLGLEPCQIIDMMGLTGDSADNVPGVPGVGPKTAIKLIQTHASMENVYTAMEKNPSKKKLDEKLLTNKEQVILSKQLVTIDTNAPIRFNPHESRVTPPDKKVLGDLFQELEFRQLQQQYFKAATTIKKTYHVILDTPALKQLVRKLETSRIFAIDTETTSQDPMRAELVGISVALRPHEAYYIPCGHDYPGIPEQIPLTTLVMHLQPVLENVAIGKIGQNIKYDWTVLARAGLNLNGVVFDTMIASYLINPSKRAHSLDQIALDFLNHQTTSYKDVVGKNKTGQGFEAVAIDKATHYACEDADITLMASEILKPELETLGLPALFENVEMPLVDVLRRMEMRGVCVDQDRLRNLSTSFETELKSLEDQIYEQAGESFNVKSSQQLGKILFEKLGLPVQKKTRKKTGYSTDVEVLTTLSSQHKVPALVLRHRTLSKLKSTYADALLDLVHPETQRIHTSFNQTVAATGRLSSSDPNLQNIPIRTKEGRQIRSAFIPRKDWVLMSADYSQIELRLLAHCSDDDILIKAFLENEDIHRRTAAEVFQTPSEMVTDDLRRQAKVINFGIIYGMGAYSLARELGISHKMAATYIKNYFLRYQGVKRYIDDTIDLVRETKQTETLLGRIRKLPEIKSKNANVRGFAERTAVNTPIQGSAADLIKLAMIQTDRALEKNDLRAAMLLSVHDEIVFEVPPDEVGTTEKLVTKVMENVWDLNVPLKVNVASGTNWSQAH